MNIANSRCHSCHVGSFRVMLRNVSVDRGDGGEEIRALRCIQDTTKGEDVTRRGDVDAASENPDGRGWMSHLHNESEARQGCGKAWFWSGDVGNRGQKERGKDGKADATIVL